MVEVYRTRAFTRDPSQGNPAGVIINHDLSLEQMQTIASELDYPETAFVRTKPDGTYNSRFFTPQEEIAFCGHATIAAAQVLIDKNIIDSYSFGISRVTQFSEKHETLVDYRPNQPIMMHQPAARFHEIDWQRRRIAEMLGITLHDIGRLPVQHISTMTPVAIVQIKSLEILRRIMPDLEAIKEYTVANKLGGGGIYAFTYNQEASSEIDLYARSFDPEVGVDEDGATGVAAGALACYLNHYDLNHKQNYVISQGFDMNQKSTIYTSVTTNTVKVGGYAVNLGTKDIKNI